MSLNATSATDFVEIPPRYSEWRRVRKVFLGRRIVIFGLIVIVMIIMIAILAPVIAPYDPYELDLGQALVQPNAQHLLGTDSVGRDTLSRVIYGSQTSLMVGIVATAIAASIGTTLGLLAGYFGGVVNAFIMRFIDALMTLPRLLLALVLAAAIGIGLKNVTIALGIGMMPVYARLMCGQVLSVRENEYILAGRALGASDLRIMLMHVLPNAFPPLIVLMTMELGLVILAEASLSFLGLGVGPPVPAWGAMVNDGYKYLLTHPVLSFAPGVSIMLVVFGFNMVGDGLRDALDPRLRGTL